MILIFSFSLFALSSGRTVLSSFVMARESMGSDRLRSERYPSSLFSSSGSGALSASSCGGTGADGAGLSLLTVEPSVLLPPSDREKDNRNKNLFNRTSFMTTFSGRLSVNREIIDCFAKRGHFYLVDVIVN